MTSYAKLTILGLLFSAATWTVRDAAAEATASRAATAMNAAAKNNKYLFVFFYAANDQGTAKMNGIFQAAMAKLTDRADSISVNIADPAEKPIIDKFKIRGAPMPLVLAIAPNGAPTRAFPKSINEAQLQEALISPCWAQCVKAVFERRSVLLCVQNAKTEGSKDALEGAEAFKADPQYAKGTEVVVLDPADQAEQAFLKALQVDPKTASAVTVLITPPGAPSARFLGAVSKEMIEAKLKEVQTNCGPGCSCH